MLNTVNTSADHYTKGYHSSGSGPTKILILGSCRVVPYVNYFNWLNAGNRFTVNLVNVVNFYFDITGKQLDQERLLQQLTGRKELESMIASTDWFIHEHTESFGMLNTDRNQPVNIYQHGMKAGIDIAIPNFNNIFILFQEMMDFNPALKARAKADMASGGALSKDLQDEIRVMGLKRIGDFIHYCDISSLPEMGDLFANTWREVRYFWTGSHISNRFTIAVMRLMNEKYLHMNLPDAFWMWVQTMDMYSSPASPITQYDRDNFGITWPQATVPIKV